MIAGLPHPVDHSETRACPAIVDPGAAAGPFAALLPIRQVHHPLACHRPRIPDLVIFDKPIQVRVFGCGYCRIADATCSTTTGCSAWN
jgi:hypothetical protein